MTCTCQDPRGFRGDPPEKFPELVIDREDGRFPAVIEVHCSVCGARWKVLQIPYGGIYGDFEWQRVAGSSGSVSRPRDLIPGSRGAATGRRERLSAGWR